MEGPRKMQLNRPEPFNPSKNNVSGDWRLWKENFLIYLELTEARRQLSKRRLALFLLNLIGPVGLEAKENMTFDDLSEEENMEILLKKFDEIFDPPLNEIEERYKFFSRRKYKEESIQNYVTCLKELAANCNFGNQVEKFIVDMVVLNADHYLQQHILTIKDLNLSLPAVIKLYGDYLINDEKMRNICDVNSDKLLLTDDLIDSKKANNNFLQNINELESKAESSKDPTYTKEKNTNKNNIFQSKEKVCGTCFETGHCSEDCNKVQNNFDRQTSSKNRVDIQNQPKAVNSCSECGANHQLNQCPARKIQKNTKRVCFRCNTQHPPRQCPAYNVTCSYCHKLGHFEHVCKSKQIPVFFSHCPHCKITPLQNYNEDYDYCKHCKVLVHQSDEESYDDSDSSTAVEAENPHTKRRPRRRQRRNRRSKNDESCCIS